MNLLPIFRVADVPVEKVYILPTGNNMLVPGIYVHSENPITDEELREFEVQRRSERP